MNEGNNSQYMSCLDLVLSFSSLFSSSSALHHLWYFLLLLLSQWCQDVTLSSLFFILCYYMYVVDKKQQFATPKVSPHMTAPLLQYNSIKCLNLGDGWLLKLLGVTAALVNSGHPNIRIRVFFECWC